MRRLTHIAVLAYAVAFFGVVMPAHRPGAVPLPGVKAAGVDASGSVVRGGASCPLCFAFGVGSPGESETPPTHHKSGCALCHLKGQLDTPPPAVVAALGVEVDLGELSPPAVTPLVSQVDAHGCVRGRAPPSVA